MCSNYHNYTTAVKKHDTKNWRFLCRRNVFCGICMMTKNKGSVHASWIETVAKSYELFTYCSLFLQS